MAAGTSHSITGVLLVRERAQGPVIYAKWRDSDRGQVMRRLGLGWLVAVGDELAKPRGARLGDWVERKGRTPEAQLDVRGAHDAMRSAIDEREVELVLERRRSELLSERGLTVAVVAERWLAHGRTELDWKPSTAGDYANVAGRICRELGHRRIEAVTEEELREFLGALLPERNGRPTGSPCSARMKTKYAVAVKAIFRFAEEQRWIERSAAERLRTPKKRRKSKNHPVRREEYLTPEEVHALLRCAAPDDGAFFITLAFAGLRLGEALALRWRDVDFSRSSLHIERSWTKA